MNFVSLIVGVVALGLVIYDLVTRVRPVPALLSGVAGKYKGPTDPWSSLGPNTAVYAVGTGASAKSIPAYYKRQALRLSLDTAVTTAVVYGLLNPGSGVGQNGTASASNFHFALSTTQPPFELEYTGAIQLVANSGTIQVGAIEY